MAMTADDLLRLQGKFVPLDDYRVDKEKTDARLGCVEKSQSDNNLVIVRIDTQLKIIMWLCSVIGIAIIGLVIKQFWG